MNSISTHFESFVLKSLHRGILGLLLPIVRSGLVFVHPRRRRRPTAHEQRISMHERRTLHLPRVLRVGEWRREYLQANGCAILLWTCWVAVPRCMWECSEEREGRVAARCPLAFYLLTSPGSHPNHTLERSKYGREPSIGRFN